jgi:LAGLIDADG DNA endonuclease family protein
LTYLGNHTKSSPRPLLSNLKVKTPLSNNYPYSGISNRFLTSIRTHHSGASSQLGHYLAGLIEGDGSIILRKGEREKTSPKIVFTFSVNELKMFEKLQEILNTGSINIEKEGVNKYATGASVKKIGVCRYSITNVDGVIKIINLVNGKFRTPKIAALHKAIDNLNK